MKSRQKIIRAVKLVESGMSKRSASRMTGVDTKTISTNLVRYRANGEAGIVVRRHYSQEQKMEIVKKATDSKHSITLVAAEYGIPAITIRRWIKKFKSQGANGLMDRRCVDYEMNIITQKAILATVNLLHSETDEYLKSIPTRLVKMGAFQNLAFESFLGSLGRSCQFIFSKPQQFGPYEESQSIAYGAARASLLFYQRDFSERASAQEIIERDEAQIFIQMFMDIVPEHVHYQH